MDRLLTVTDACEILGWAKATFYNKKCRGELRFPIVRAGRCLRVRPADLENYINSGGDQPKRGNGPLCDKPAKSRKGSPHV